MRIYVGWDIREAIPWRVLEHSIKRLASQNVEIIPLILGDLQYKGLYTRPTEIRNGRLWDVISEAPMSTEFAITRFLVPHLAKTGWAMFMDCDMLLRTDITKILFEIEQGRAVHCVHHMQEANFEPKMDGQIQVPYPRKNWSSLMLFNCDHEANKKLTPELVNAVPGRDLHAFNWLDGEPIGELHAGWNWLEGHSKPVDKLNVIHYTRGGPWMKEYENVEYANLWQHEKQLMLSPEVSEAA